VKLEDTIKGFKEIIDANTTIYPSRAFYMVGTIEEAVEAGNNTRNRFVRTACGSGRLIFQSRELCE